MVNQLKGMITSYFTYYTLLEHTTLQYKRSQCFLKNVQIFHGYSSIFVTLTSIDNHWIVIVNRITIILRQSNLHYKNSYETYGVIR